MKFLLNTKISYLVMVAGLLLYNTIAADTLPKATFKGQNPSDIVAKTHKANANING